MARRVSTGIDPDTIFLFRVSGGALFERVQELGDAPPSSFLLGDLSAALFGTIGVLSALEARHRTGLGTYVDVAMSDTVAALMSVPIAMAHNGSGNFPGPSSEPAYDVFRTFDDKYITISIAHEDTYWRRFCSDLGLSRLVGLSREERVGNRKAINLEIRAKIEEKPYAFWEGLFVAADQMFGPAHSLQTWCRIRIFVRVVSLNRFVCWDGRVQTVVRQPLKFAGFRNAQLYSSPALGEHTSQIVGSEGVDS